MIVIEDMQTSKKYTYPSTNANIETPTGFVQVQYVPMGFRIANNQDSSGLQPFLHDWPARPKDPLNQTHWRDKI